MFSPQGVPKVTKGSGEGAGLRVLQLAADELAPWEPGHPATATPPRPGLTWQFTIYGGLFDIASARAYLVKIFGEDTQPVDARGGGQTALFAFTLDADGCMVANSATLSACAWALSRLHAPGPEERAWLDGFEVHEREFSNGLDKLVPPKLERPSDSTGSKFTRATKAISDHAKDAAVDAVAAGAKATGTAVTTATAAAVGSVAGPVAGGIAGAVAGTFAEKLLTPKVNDEASAEAPDKKPSHTRAPRLSMTARNLHEFVSELASALGVAEPLAAGGVRVKCAQVPVRDSDGAVEQNFLNSHIADDLSQIERAIRDGDIGQGLRDYLRDSRDLATNRRVDVRACRGAVVEGVEPRGIPVGRWPAAVTKPLVISQQFAVNQILAELGDGAGVFAVNGPPGTGKTTMLRDVLAAIVVERAKRLAELDDASHAFTDVVEHVQLSKYRLKVRGLRPDLAGFEVVVATASNDAAANLTAEIPSVDAVRGLEDEAVAVDYFTDLACRVLDGEAWGMVAAVLGNMKNRKAFVGRFWFGDGPSNRRDQAATESDESGNLGMRETLRNAHSRSVAIPDWHEAVAAFRASLAEVRRLADIRQDTAKAIREFVCAQGKVEQARAELEQATSWLESRHRGVAQSEACYAQSVEAFSEVDREFDEHLRTRPGFWVSLSTWFRAGRDWNVRSADLQEKRASARSEVTRTGRDVAERRSELATAVLVRHRCESTLNDGEHEIATARARIDAGCAQWPGVVPFGDAFAEDEPFQLCAPWADEEFIKARHRLFLESLRLHKAFILNSASEIRGNLAVISAVLQGRVEVKPQARLAAWQSLFLVVPMISTAFASLPRLFSGLGSESFGWLFIDEAGQATPQQAVGGLWRARRTVIVGDPQQLEPIVTLPSPAQHALRRHYDVDEQWTPEFTSAQRVADRLARHGTFLPEPDGESQVWVGAPLRVHRRCDRPMFEVSNTIAYGGDLMVYGTKHAGDFPGENAWIDVRAGQSRGNWVPAEGQALLDLLDELSAKGVPMRDVRVISPFRDVVRGVKDLVRRPYGEDFADKNVGTVHTVQGQESDVIVLVLGSAPANARAREWAAEKPNLLNVAVSRAKRRLYVVGNRRNWEDQRYFSVLARTLPARGLLP